MTHDDPSSQRPLTLPRPVRALPDVGSDPDDRQDAQRHLAPRYAVILHNDPISTFEFVVGVLQRVFGYDVVKAFGLTLQAHTSGRSRVWVGAFEIAEHRAEQIKDCGPDPAKSDAGARPLSVSLEQVD